MKKDPNAYPPDWDAKSIGNLAKHYDGQSDDEAIAEDEAALADATLMVVPHDLVPEVRKLIDKHQARR